MIDVCLPRDSMYISVNHGIYLLKLLCSNARGVVSLMLSSIWAGLTLLQWFITRASHLSRVDHGIW